MVARANLGEDAQALEDCWDCEPSGHHDKAAARQRYAPLHVRSGATAHTGATRLSCASEARARGSRAVAAGAFTRLGRSGAA
eukprot:5454637-Pyramimonas_sp.AAC.1